MDAPTGTRLEGDGSRSAAVIQLRVHGVGGATPDGLLGLPEGSEVVRVAGDEAAAVYARPEEPHVEGYVWSKLTRSAWAQALWIILLPFTLFNVANWMYPRRGDRDPTLVLSRAVMLVLGISLTVGYLLWEMSLLQQVFYQWQLGGWVATASEWGWVRALLPAGLESPEGLGYVLSVLALFLVNFGLYLLAQRSRRDFEDVTSPVFARGAATEPKPALIGFPVWDRDSSRAEELRSGHFWARAREGKRLLRLHVAVELAFLAAFAVMAFPRVEEGVEGLGLGPLFKWTTRVQVILIVALFALYLIGYASRRETSGFRYAGPPVFVTMAIMLTIAAFTGLSSFLGARTGLPPAVVLDLSPAFGAGLLALLGGLLVWAIVHWLWRKREMDGLRGEQIEPRELVPGDLPRGISPRMFGRVALYRSFASSFPRLDVVFTATAVAFIASVGLLVFWEEVRFPTWIGTFGAWLVTGFVTILLPLLIYRSFKVSARAKVGIIWDVLTFWPRRFQPFAVRPYAERAVPELERRILRHLEADRRVIVCAHSQGSILAYAALMELAQHYPDKTANVALVTFGSPLRTLYGKFFPGYFAPGELAWLRERLLQSPAGPCITWKNFYRRTDYIGQALFGEDFPGCDEKIPDPPARDPYGRIDPEVPVGVPADPPQPAWTRALTHSYYNNSLELREWVDRVLPAAMREPRRVEA